MIGKYGKAVLAAIGAVVTWATLVINSAPADITSEEWGILGTGLLTAIGVFAVSNAPQSTQ
jgi:hypothetical protein